ncbi:MAG: 50S ribosomal protein L35 [Mycoplasmoidaceae bacterium]
MKVKQKSKRAVMKRMKRTKGGEIKRKQAYRSHMAHNKTTKTKRHLRKDSLVSKSDKARYDQVL